MLAKWVERERNPSWAFSHVTAGNEFRFARPILLVLATLLAIVPFANAQSVEEKAQAW
jgi:hypothetical protein